MADRDWERLAEFARERRDELGLTQEDVRAAGGPSTASIRLIEGALQRAYQPATLRDLEKALQWERGSVSRILAGGDPMPINGVIVSLSTAVVPPRRPLDDESPLRLHRGADLFPGVSAQLAPDVERFFRELEARVLRAASAEAGRRTEAEGRPVFAQDVIDDVPPGALIFGNGTEAAAAWDRLAARGFSTWQITQGIAVVRALGSTHWNTGDSGETAVG